MNKGITVEIKIIYSDLDTACRWSSSVCASYFKHTWASCGWQFPRWPCHLCPHTSRNLWRASTAWACSLPAHHTAAWRSRPSPLRAPPPPPGTWSWRLKMDAAEGSETVRATWGQWPVVLFRDVLYQGFPEHKVSLDTEPKNIQVKAAFLRFFF